MNEYVVWAGPLIALGTLVYAIWLGNNKKHARKFEDIGRSIGTVESQVMEVKLSVELRVDKIEDRVLRIEGEIGHLPDKDVTHRLELALTKMNGEMSAMKESIKPISAMAARIQEAIIEKVTT